MYCMSLALYRKYRPQKFGDLIGQDSLVSVLQNSLKSDKLHHAYLFIGSRGTGKTSTARIMAKAINCTNFNKEKLEPCSECNICISIANGSYLDLIEIDAASNRGIDDIRDLRDKIKLAPTEGKFKVYIIDEVHMLTNEAFNALLKTLEEPPAHALFILCTTDPQKLPATIVSRCLKMEFRRPTLEDLTTKLSQIAASEKIKLSKKILDSIAQVAGGAFRDAEVMFEKVASVVSEGKDIDEDSIELLIGVGNKDSLLEFLGPALSGEVRKAFLWLDSYIKGGGEPKVLNVNILESARFLLLIKMGLGEALVKKEVSPLMYDFLTSQSEKISREKIVKVNSIFTQALENLKVSTIPILPLEVAVAELSLETNPEKGEELPEEPKRTEPKTTEKEGLDSKKLEVKESVSPKESPKAEQSVQTAPKNGLDGKEELGEGMSLASNEAKMEEIISKWAEVVTSIRATNSSIYAVLTSCELRDYDGKILTVAVPYSFHKDRLEESKNRKVVEKVLSELVGTDVKIRGILGEKKKRNMKLEDIRNVEPVSDKELMDNALDIFNSGLIND